jgi:hypothetical protein
MYFSFTSCELSLERERGAGGRTAPRRQTIKRSTVDSGSGRRRFELRFERARSRLVVWTEHESGGLSRIRPRVCTVVEGIRLIAGGINDIVVQSMKRAAREQRFQADLRWLHLGRKQTQQTGGMD